MGIGVLSANRSGVRVGRHKNMRRNKSTVENRDGGVFSESVWNDGGTRNAQHTHKKKKREHAEDGRKHGSGVVTS